MTSSDIIQTEVSLRTIEPELHLDDVSLQCDTELPKPEVFHLNETIADLHRSTLIPFFSTMNNSLSLYTKKNSTTVVTE